MGYTTTFTGCINLSRKLTLREAGDWMHITVSGAPKELTGINAYMKWVPTETLDRIIWDGGEKFYEYEAQLRWICQWLKDLGIEANGELLWSGESMDDAGRLTVAANEVRAIKMEVDPLRRPLTQEKLGEMALDLLPDEILDAKETK